MQLIELNDMIPARWDTRCFDEWSSDLKAICGNFEPLRHEKSNRVTGTARVIDAGGLEIAQVANDLHAVNRDQQAIKRDYGENLFLLLQLEGICGIEQYGRQSIINPGDCILVDSSSPSIFHFGGRFSNHLSVHLPRQLLFADKAAAIALSRRLGADDPMTSMLRALVAKLLKTADNDRRAPQLRQLLFSATRQAFALDEEFDAPVASESSGARLEIVQILIDRHLTEDHLSPQWLADRVGISLRTLQDDFSTIGTTATSLIRTRRLHLAREQLLQMKDQGDGATIAEVAYSSGFNDISYFNRCFRKAFSCSPKDILGQ